MFVPEIKVEDLMGNGITTEEGNLITFFDEAYKAKKTFDWEAAKENFRKWLRSHKLNNGQIWSLENSDLFSQFLIKIGVAKISKIYIDTLSKTYEDFASNYEVTDYSIYDRKHDKTYTT